VSKLLRISRRHAVGLLGAAWLMPHSTAWAQGTHSMPLSALSQRCAKAYSQQALQVLPEQCKTVMLDTQQAIAASMLKLKGVRHAQLQQEVRRFDTLLTAAPGRKILLAVSHQSNVLQSAAERDDEPGVMHALATLSQRMAKNYFMLAWGVDQADARLQLLLDQRTFAPALQSALQQPKLLTLPQRRALELTQAQWAFYEAALKATPTPDKQQQVASASERMWQLLWPLNT
jgi:hypothetical protein